MLTASLFTGAVSETLLKPQGFAFDDPEIFIDNHDRAFIIVEGDTIHIAFLPMPDSPKHYGPLQDEDFVEIAEELGVEAAAIRAVVDIETGKTHRGFYAEDKPVINFDLAVFRKAAARRKVDLKPFADSPALRPLDMRKYGGHQPAMQARLDAAMEIDFLTAMESTFWGMFQLGGFNWKLCGAESPQDFVRRMSRSEYDQLKLFANFIRNTGLLPHLKNRNWAAFSKIYNGPGYAARGYHTRMASAYKRYKSQERTKSTDK